MANDTLKIKQLINICNEILKENSRNLKEQILLAYSHNEDFKMLMKFMYDDLITTGLDVTKLNMSNLECECNYVIRDFDDLIRYLRNNNTGTYANVKSVQNYINLISKDDIVIKEFLNNISIKNLQLGITSKTLNKVYGNNFIPKWEVQQAYGIDKYKFSKNEWFAITEKLNGVRATYYNGKLVNRQGREILGCDYIIEELKSLSKDKVLDGELIRKNIDCLDDNENFRLTAGIVNSKDKVKNGLEFVIFDVVNIEDFEQDNVTQAYSDRRFVLDSLYNLKLNNVKVAKLIYSGVDKSAIDKELLRVSEEGKEGLMVNLDVPYKRKRHKGILKVKKFNTMDLEIVGFEEGRNKYKDKLGALLVDYKGNNVGVGTGLTDYDREYIWNNRRSLLGRVVEVKYKEISKDKTTGCESLQFPVYCRLRTDGKDVSYE